LIRKQPILSSSAFPVKPVAHHRILCGLIFSEALVPERFQLSSTLQRSPSLSRCLALFSSPSFFDFRLSFPFNYNSEKHSLQCKLTADPFARFIPVFAVLKSFCLSCNPVSRSTLSQLRTSPILVIPPLQLHSSSSPLS